MSTNVIFELTGTARVLARKTRVPLTVPQNGTWHDIVAALAQAVPSLVGDVITKDKRNLVGGYVINVNGRYSIPHLDTRIDCSSGDSLTLLEDAC